jgi:two-component system, NarL family, sensor kinase
VAVVPWPLRPTIGTVQIDADASGPRSARVRARTRSYTLVRELLSNAERHARAHTLTVRIQRVLDTLVIEVEGAGNAPERFNAALREGHIGLASSSERVEALGGKFSILTGEDEAR